MGSNYSELVCPRCDVLVLFPKCPWNSCPVEGMDNTLADHSVCARPGYVLCLKPQNIFSKALTLENRICILCILGLCHQHLRATVAAYWKMRRGALCCGSRRCNFELISSALHLFLCRHVQEGSQKRRGNQSCPKECGTAARESRSGSDQDIRKGKAKSKVCKQGKAQA